MTEDRGPGRPTDPMQTMWDQLRSMAEQFGRMSAGGFGTASAATPGPAIPTMPPLPGALTAAQLRSIAASVAAQRSAIASLGAQLEAFDSQLEVLESILTPLLAWSRSWANAEKSFTPNETTPQDDDPPPA